MTERKFRVAVEVDVIVTIPEAHAAEVLTDEWRSNFYMLSNHEDLAQMLAFNAVVNGERDTERMDGWVGIKSASMMVERDGMEFDVWEVSDV